MQAVDTNVLVRFLVNDDPNQARQVLNLFQQLEKADEQVLVPTIVLLELCWVVASGYRFSRDEVIQAVDDLLLLPVLKFEYETAVQQCVLEAQAINADLSDLLIAHVARAQGCNTVWTFDRKALRCS